MEMNYDLTEGSKKIKTIDKNASNVLKQNLNGLD